MNIYAKAYSKATYSLCFFDKFLFLEYPSIGISATGMPSSFI